MRRHITAALAGALVAMLVPAMAPAYTIQPVIIKKPVPVKSAPLPPVKLAPCPKPGPGMRALVYCAR